MNENETQAEYEARLKEEGIDIPKEESNEEKDPKEEPAKEDPKEDKEGKKEETDPKEDDKSTLPDQKEFKTRSIYDEYKDKKSELKSEKERRKVAEKEVLDLKEKLAKADTPEEKQEALDDIEEFAKEIGADPEAIKKMQKVFLKGVKTNEPDESLKKDLEEFKSWKEQNKEVVEKQAFNSEFESVLPQLKKDFPKASDDELKSIKTKLDEISHSKDFHDKSLDYVIFKNKKDLSDLVSPKKKGLESKEKNDVNADDFEFDPNADISKLSPKQLEQWEKAYNKATSSSELISDSKGGKLIL